MPSSSSGMPQYAQPIDDEEYMDEEERFYMMQQMQNQQHMQQRAVPLPTKAKVPGQGEACPWAQVCV